MRRAARVDRNQAEIVVALRAGGASVQPLHAVGRGVPDLLVGWRGKNFLLELKDGTKSLSRQDLTGAELAWIRAWDGQVSVVSSADEALDVVFGIGIGGDVVRLEI